MFIALEKYDENLSAAFEELLSGFEKKHKGSDWPRKFSVDDDVLGVSGKLEGYRTKETSWSGNPMLLLDESVSVDDASTLTLWIYLQLVEVYPYLVISLRMGGSVFAVGMNEVHEYAVPGHLLRAIAYQQAKETLFSDNPDYEFEESELTEEALEEQIHDRFISLQNEWDDFFCGNVVSGKAASEGLSMKDCLRKIAGTKFMEKVQQKQAS
jgi:hypothetical protein